MVFDGGTQKLIDDALAKTAAEYAAKNAATQISADPRAAGFKGSDVGQAETLRYLQNKYDSPTSQLPAGSNVPFNYRTAQRGSMMRPAGSAMTAGKELAMTGRTSDPRAAAVQLRELKKQYGDRFAQVPAGQVVPERYGDAAGVPVPKTLGLGDVDWEEVQRRIDAQNAANVAEIVDPPMGPPPAGPPPAGPPPVGPPPAGPASNQYYRPADMEETIRELFGERQATDLSQDIIDLISGRRTSLTNAEARRNEQIGEIARTLTGDIGALETDRTAQQQALIDAIAGRAGGLTTSSEDRIAAARQALGPQVTDEFEQAAALASGLASSQAASSQDAMSRLAQIANMAAAERGAAPTQLAAESRLALGDEAFRIGESLNAEESQRLLDEQLRLDQFKQARDQDMINALLGDEMRREQFLVDEGMRLQGQDYQAGQAQLDRDFRSDEARFDRDFRSDEAELARDFQGDQAKLDRDFRQREAKADRSWRSTETTRGHYRDMKNATTAFDRSKKLMEIEQDYKQVALDAEADVAAEATRAEDIGNEYAGNYYQLGDAVVDADGNVSYPMGGQMWDAMSPTERKAVRDDWAKIQAGNGTTYGQGSYQTMVSKYGPDAQPLIMQAQAMLSLNDPYVPVKDGWGTLIGPTQEEHAAEVKKAQEDYMERLTSSSGLEGPAIDASEKELIFLYLREMQDIRDEENLAWANAINDTTQADFVAKTEPYFQGEMEDIRNRGED